MKKLFSLILALTMMASMTTVAFAATRYAEKEGKGAVTVNTDDVEVEPDELVPGTKYTFEILLDDSEIEQWDETTFAVTARGLSASAATGGDCVSATNVVSGIDVTGSKNHKYLSFTTKSGNKNPGDSYDFEIQIQVTEKGDRDYYEVSSKKELDRLKADGFELDSKTKVEDVVFYRYIDNIEFTVSYPDVDTINDDEYEVDNKSPIVYASNDVGKCTLSFSDVAEYEAKFSSKEKKYNLGYSFSPVAAIEKANPNAELTFVTFSGKPNFAANSDLLIFADDAKYMYEIGSNNSLTKLGAKFNSDGATFRTQQLTSYVVSDRALKGATGSTSSSSSGGSTSSGITVGSSSVEALFNKYYSNDIVVVDTDGKTSRLSVSADWDALNTNALWFYNYNLARNSYSRIAAPAYSISGDTVTFSGSSGDYVIVTDRALSSGSNSGSSTSTGTTTTSTPAGITVGNSSIENVFNKYFANDLVVLNMNGKVSTPTKVTVTVDLSDLSTGSLRFYNYDAAKNSYTQIIYPNYSVNGNKLTFTATQGKAVLITDRAWADR